VSDTIDTVRLTDADAAFILGKAGKTKEKIAKVSGATVELPPRSMTLEISGSASQRRRAKKYVECVMAQRSGDVVVDERDKYFMEDCTLVDVPTECVGFVTGTNGNFLRTLEAENETIMFFVVLRGEGSRKGRGVEHLAIFGKQRGQRACELKVFAALEQKIPGHCTRNLKEGVSDSNGFGTDYRRLATDEISWALGKKGATRKKLASASGAIVEYIGNWVHISGTKAERQRAQDYLKCVMDQMDNHHSQMSPEGRDDVTVMNIPQDCVGFVMGNKRATLTRIEEESGAFMLFLDRRGESSGRDSTVKLGIFGLKRKRRAAELKVMSSVEGKSPGHFTRNMREGVDDREWGTDYFRLRGEEFSYALGKDGTTRKKLAKAAHCLMEYIGEYAVMSGTRAERERASRYLKWLLKQKSGAVSIEGLDIDDRLPDVRVIDVPPQSIAFVMGPRGSELRKIEDETNTFLFMARDRGGQDVLVICGAEKSDRRHAEYAIHQTVNEWESGASRRGGDDHQSDDDRDSQGPPAKFPRRSPSYDRYRRSRTPDRRVADRRSRDRYDSRDRDRRSRDRGSRDRRDRDRDSRRSRDRYDSRDRRDDRKDRKSSRDRYDDRDRRDDRRSRDRDDRRSRDRDDRRSRDRDDRRSRDRDDRRRSR